MANRCSSCSKLCGLEMQDPEVEFAMDDRGVSFTARVVRCSACCGDEVKEANFDGSKDHSDELEKHLADEELTGEEAIERAAERGENLTVVNSDGSEYELASVGARALLTTSPERAKDITLTVEHELEVEEDEIEGTERSEGKGRGMKSFYGFRATYDIVCACQPKGADPLVSGEFTDEMQASSMDELG